MPPKKHYRQNNINPWTAHSTLYSSKYSRGCNLVRKQVLITFPIFVFLKITENTTAFQ